MWVIAVAGLAVACGPSGEGRAVPRLGAADALERYRGFMQARLPDSVGSMYGPEAGLLEPGIAAITGPDSVAAYYARLWSASPLDSIAYTTEFVDLDESGQHAAIVGTFYERYASADSAHRVRTGRFVALMGLTASLEWRMRRFFTQPAP